jgi:5-methylcytosine-specific restriction protein A
MPKLPPKPCRHRGCGKATTNPRGLCDEHQGHSWDKGKDGRKRESSYRRGYGRAWREIRVMVLRQEPLCRVCGEEGRLAYATQVDHIDGDAFNNERTNLQAICEQCHAKKTARER